MGTNFYWIKEYREIERAQEQGDEDFDRMSPEVHIGKRSAAGLYCWNCMISLHEGGESWVHGPPERYGMFGGMFDDALRRWKSMKMLNECPKCGAERGSEHVRSACSFSYAQSPARVKKRCDQSLDEPCVVDEYGEEFTGEQFLEALEHCPIIKTSMIGEVFC